MLNLKHVKLKDNVLLVQLELPAISRFNGNVKIPDATIKQQMSLTQVWIGTVLKSGTFTESLSASSTTGNKVETAFVRQVFKEGTKVFVPVRLGDKWDIPLEEVTMADFDFPLLQTLRYDYVLGIYDDSNLPKEE